uniref:Uncharacterized protein n=1 Tax=Pristionchus pacificus TaxID=54126 RepID=A0A2A6BU83_PRIPA|eukprot:PDM69474.1 hypothetical protein PRIPAC_44570 [Pristionchus pacificus]
MVDKTVPHHIVFRSARIQRRPEEEFDHNAAKRPHVHRFGEWRANEDLGSTERITKLKSLPESNAEDNGIKLATF